MYEYLLGAFSSEIVRVGIPFSGFTADLTYTVRRHHAEARTYSWPERHSSPERPSHPLESRELLLSSAIYGELEVLKHTSRLVRTALC